MRVPVGSWLIDQACDRNETFSVLWSAACTRFPYVVRTRAYMKNYGRLAFDAGRYAERRDLGLGERPLPPERPERRLHSVGPRS